MISTNVHGFSRSFAREHGVTTAVILRHIGYKVRTSKTVRDEKRWHYNSAAKLQPKLPYFKRSTISATLKKASTDGLVEAKDRYNPRKKDRTLHYSMTDAVCAEVEDDVISFDKDVAKEYGVLAAVLHCNLCHFIGKQLKKKRGVPEHTMSPPELAKILPFSESAIKKTLAKMVKDGVIVKCPDQMGRYTLPDDDLQLLRQKR